jgi:hypothetical protein
VGVGAGAVVAFCEGVRNGPPLDVVLAGCPNGRWSRTSTIKQARELVVWDGYDIPS